MKLPDVTLEDITSENCLLEFWSYLSLLLAEVYGEEIHERKEHQEIHYYGLYYLNKIH